MTARTRAEQLDAILELAVWLEANPDIPLPHNLTGDSEYSYELIHARHGADQKAVLAACARALPGKVTKRVLTNDESLFNLAGQLPGGINIRVIADRDEVCERVVVGTREVTEKVPDPSVDVPLVEVTKTVEDVEWRCAPVLS